MLSLSTSGIIHRLRWEYPVDHEKAIRYLQLTARSICEFFERYDVLLTPTAPTPPVPIGALQPTRAEMALLRVLGRLNAGWLMKTPAISRRMAAHSYDFIGYTIPFNVTGQPAMSVPLHWNEAGLPIDMHFVGASATRPCCSASPASLSARSLGQTACPPSSRRIEPMEHVVEDFSNAALSAA